MFKSSDATFLSNSVFSKKNTLFVLLTTYHTFTCTINESESSIVTVQILHLFPLRLFVSTLAWAKSYANKVKYFNKSMKSVCKEKLNWKLTFF